MQKTPPPLPAAFSPLPPRTREEALNDIRMLAIIASRTRATAPPVDIPMLAMRVNELILANELEPYEICKALEGTSFRTKALTGHTKAANGKRVYSDDEMFDALQRHPTYMVDAMKHFPGKVAAIDLSKLTKAVNSGKFKAPPQAW